MAEEEKKAHNPALLLVYALFNAFLFNSPAILLAFESLNMAYFALFKLSIITVISILSVELVTWLAAKFRGGKGTYWQQLAITNLYLTPVSLSFAILLTIQMALATLASSDLVFEYVIMIPVMFVSATCLMNLRKMRVVHGINDLLPTIVYGLGMAVFYIIWALTVLILVMGMALN